MVRIDSKPSEIALWAASGAMWLTGRSDGAPAAGPGAPASAVAEALRRLHALRPQADLPDVRLLGERAAAGGLHRAAPLSCGGTFRVVPTSDGHLGLSLARPHDHAVVPALVESDHLEDAWQSIEQWAQWVPTLVAVERGRLLGLPITAVPDLAHGAGRASADRAGVVIHEGGTCRPRRERPRVVDFSSLWAGPLCAHLLGLCGADVVKVESAARLDGARRGPRAFYDLLHAGHRSVIVDLDAPTARNALTKLVSGADLVIEASRPRALLRMGLDADAAVATGTSWLSITARGRASDTIGFGDDIAVGAGLHTPEFWPVGDALADPLTGTVAAAEALEALARPRASLIDISMLHVSRHAATDDPVSYEATHTGGSWWVESEGGRTRVEPPSSRHPTGTAPAPGEHNRHLGIG